MAAIQATPDVLVRVPDNVQVRVVSDAPAARGLRRASRSLAPGTKDLIDALSSAEYTLAAEVELAPTAPRTRASAAPGRMQLPSR